MFLELVSKSDFDSVNNIKIIINSSIKLEFLMHNINLLIADWLEVKYSQQAKIIYKRNRKQKVTNWHLVTIKPICSNY